MTTREESSMHLLKQIYDAYYDQPLYIRDMLLGSNLNKLVNKIPPQLKKYSAEVTEGIENAVKESGIINQL